jgi:hypothetical protein
MLDSLYLFEVKPMGLKAAAELKSESLLDRAVVDFLQIALDALKSAGMK